MRTISQALIVLACSLVAFTWPHDVLAGPIELFNGVKIAPSNPDRVVARWVNGDGGFFVSDDRASTFRASCFPAITPALMGRSVQAFGMARDGSLCVGTSSQTFCSDARACEWNEVAELNGNWIADFAEDPIDSGVMYLCTGTSTGNNGLFVREPGAASWKPFGTQLPAWFSRLFVVKRDAGKRFYVSSQENVTKESPDGGPPTQEPKYFIRYSDDSAATWTSNEFTPLPERANLRLVGVDPTNPDRIVIALIRSAEQQPDDLYFSDKRGESGSYVKIGSVTEFSGVTFTPKGELYYGDNDQMTPAVYKVEKLGDAPTKLIGSYKVGCIQYEAASERLYVCADWKFGTADPATGEFSILFNIMQASVFLGCDGEPMAQRCGPAFRSPNFCDVTHYPNAPICVDNYGTGTAGVDAAGADAGGATGSAGAGASDARASGAGGQAGAGRANAGSSSPSRPDAGASRPPGTDTAPERKNSGCVVAIADSSPSSIPVLTLGFAAGLVLRRRLRRQRG